VLNVIILAVLAILVAWCEFCLRRMARRNEKSRRLVRR
jgi:hypothetical protein